MQLKSGPIVLVLGFLWHSCYAAPLVGSGDRLQMLKKIQGRWHSKCSLVTTGSSDIYRQKQIQFSFTHAQLRVTEYHSGRCIEEKARYSVKYHFVLGDELLTDDGQKVYAVDFSADEEPPSVAFLQVKNIIRFDGGELLLGLPVGLGSDQRLKRLDSMHPYRR